MKTTVVLYILLILPLFGYSQYKPIIDSSIVCSYDYEFSESPNNAKLQLEFFYIVEDMPCPKAQLSDIETKLNDGVSIDEKEVKTEGTIYIQCIVNCKGIAGDFQIIQCPEKLEYIGKQAMDVFRENLVSWNPGQQRGKNVDVLIRIQVRLKNGRLDVEAPVL